MQKQSYELITGLADRCTVHSIVYDGSEDIISFFWNVRKRVKRMLSEHPGIELIHLNNSMMAFFSLFLRNMVDIPVLLTVHGLDIVFPNVLFQRFVVPKLAKFDGVIAVSRSTAEECIRRRFKAECVDVVGNGVDHQLGDTPVDTAFLSRLEERLGLSLTCKKILLAIGRPVERKGFSWFLEEVLPRLEEDVVFILIGPQQKYFRPIRWLYRLLPRQLARSFVLMLGVSMDEPKVHAVLGTDACKGKGFWLSDLPHSEVVQLLKVADLFVMPNKKVDGDVEGFGLVALEATICATPVVASGIEGITDAVKDGENGFLLPSEDADAWVEKLTELLANRQALKRFGQQAQQYTRQHYGWDRMVDGYLAVFRRYIEKA